MNAQSDLVKLLKHYSSYRHGLTRLLLPLLAGMATAGAWQKAARLVQHCCDQQPGTAEEAAACYDAHELIEQLQRQPPPPKAAWKKLVQQLKVGTHA